MDLPETLYYGNENLMFQVWTNLFSNAVKFTPPGGSISVRCCQTPEVIQVCIKDTGVGMTPEVQSTYLTNSIRVSRTATLRAMALGWPWSKKLSHCAMEQLLWRAGQMRDPCSQSGFQWTSNEKQRLRRINFWIISPTWCGKSPCCPLNF